MKCLTKFDSTVLAENRKKIYKYLGEGKNLVNLVFLKFPTCAVWKVELMKSHEDAWLCNDWKEFAEYYSIGRFLDTMGTPIFMSL